MTKQLPNILGTSGLQGTKNKADGHEARAVSGAHSIIESGRGRNERGW